MLCQLPRFFLQLATVHQMRYNSFMGLFNGFSKMELLDTLQNAVILHDIHGTILHVNQSMLQVFGLPDQKSAQTCNLISDFSDESEDRNIFWSNLNHLEKPDFRQFEWVCRSKDNNRMIMLASVHPYKNIYCTQLWDISQFKNIQHALSESETKYRLLAENSADVIWHMDQDFHFTYVSCSDELLRGYKAEEVIGQTFFSLLRPEGIELINEINEKRLEDEKKGLKTDMIHYELEVLCKDGSYIWTGTNVNPSRNADGDITGYYGVTRDISDRRLAELQVIEEKEKLEQTLAQLQKVQSELTFLADFDSLTRLMNRRSFQRVTETEVKRAERYHHPVVLVMLDVDNFKNVNDQFGHPIGDEVLAKLATILSNSIRQHDEVARMGGEEFALLFPETDTVTARIITERIREIIANNVLRLSNQAEVSITCSFGLAELNVHEPNFIDFYREADEALYRAKQLGKNRVEIGGS